MLHTLDAFSSALVAGLIAALMVPVNLLPDSISDAFQYAFMQRALLTSMMVGAICGMLSCYVVLKRWSLLGDAISHAVLPGVAIAYLLGLPFFIGAFVTGRWGLVLLSAILELNPMRQWVLCLPGLLRLALC